MTTQELIFKIRTLTERIDSTNSESEKDKLEIECHQVAHDYALEFMNDILKNL